jgi:type III secretion system FlhB-like substrate exporter
LAISLSENPDIIQKGTSQIVYDVINCLKEKIPNLISDSNLSKKVDFLNIKQDIINLLMKSMSNFVSFIKFEEAYGYIKKAENLTGFIKDENAIKVYKNIFDILKQFNQFGTQKYEISTNLNLNVFSNNANNQLIKSIEHEDKGIKINLHLSYMLKNFKVHSVQAVVFDSPLVSFKLERKSKGGISNIFVGITLYDKEGNEIYVKDIKLDKIEILFKKSLYKSMKTCLYYNEDKNIMDNEGINTENVEFDGIEYIKCIPQHLSSFTIGSFGEEEYIQPKDEEKSFKISFLKVIVAIIIVFVLIYLYKVYRKKRVEAINNQYNA